MIAQLLLQIGNADTLAEAERALAQAKNLRTAGSLEKSELEQLREAFKRRRNLLVWASRKPARKKQAVRRRKVMGL